MGMLRAVVLVSVALLACVAAGFWLRVTRVVEAMATPAALPLRLPVVANVSADDDADEALAQPPLISLPSRYTVSRARYDRAQNLLGSMARGVFASPPSERRSPSTDDFVPANRAAAAWYANFTRSMAQRCMRNRRVFLTGTSFQRTLFWSLIRLLLPEGATVPSPLLLIASGEAVVKHFAQGEACDPVVNGATFHEHAVPWLPPDEQATSCLLVRDDGCNYPGPAGVDIKRCGMPQNGTWRSSPALNVTVHFQFKTYLKTRAVDAVIRRTITQMGPWDLVWLGSGEWCVCSPLARRRI